MLRTASLLIGALVIAGAPALAKSEPETGEARLAKLIEGRVAGKPVECLELRDIRSSRIIPGTAIVYETKGNRLYVNRPESGADTLDSWDVMVTDTHLSRLCNIDVVHLHDTGTRMQTGLVFLGDFVPYDRPDR